MASGFWLFYTSRFSCFDISSDTTFDPAEVMLTLFSLGIFYLCRVLVEHCTCLSYFGGAISQSYILINVTKSESSADCTQGACLGLDQSIAGWQHMETIRSDLGGRSEKRPSQTGLGICAVRGLWNSQIITPRKKNKKVVVVNDVLSWHTDKFWRK